MADIIRKMILAKYPDYDFERYRYRFGDVVKLNTDALILVKESALDYVDAIIIKSGFGYKKGKIS